MTTYTQARDQMVTALNNAWTTNHPTIPILYENTMSVDLDTVGDIFVKASIDFEDAFQSDMDPAPGFEAHGVITLVVFVKEGKGSRSVLGIFDSVAQSLTFQRLGSSVQLFVPNPGRKSSKDGWATSYFYVPFSFYSKH